MKKRDDMDRIQITITMIIVAVIIGLFGLLANYLFERWSYHKMTALKETFFNDAIKYYGNNYSYEKTVFVNFESPVIIICKKHNHEFETLPDQLMKKTDLEKYFSGLRNELRDTIIPCPICRDEYLNTVKYDLFAKFKRIYNNRYDYNPSEYVDSHVPIYAYCTIHKNYKFKVIPKNHILGKDICKYCKKDNHSLKISTMIDKFNRIYHNRFRYDINSFTGVNKEMVAYCNKCGFKFKIIPRDHVDGDDKCPNCE